MHKKVRQLPDFFCLYQLKLFKAFIDTVWTTRRIFITLFTATKSLIWTSFAARKLSIAITVVTTYKLRTILVFISVTTTISIVITTLAARVILWLFITVTTWLTQETATACSHRFILHTLVTTFRHTKQACTLTWFQFHSFGQVVDIVFIQFNPATGTQFAWQNHSTVAGTQQTAHFQTL